MFFNGARGKARDFNWHNVIGSWCAIPLFIVVLSALPISFGWFNSFVYRVVGETPPASPAQQQLLDAVEAYFAKKQAAARPWAG